MRCRLSGESRFFNFKKKIKKSSGRNRIRRLLKESYRLNKTTLLDHVTDKQIKIRILLSLSNTGFNSHKDISFKEVSADMITLLDKILKRIR